MISLSTCPAGQVLISLSKDRVKLINLLRKMMRPFDFSTAFFVHMLLFAATYFPSHGLSYAIWYALANYCFNILEGLSS